MTSIIGLSVRDIGGYPVTVRDLRLDDGRVLRTYDGGPVEGGAADGRRPVGGRSVWGRAAASGVKTPNGGMTVIWHHGSPQTGAPLEPVLSEAVRRGIRLVSYGRPAYGTSTPDPGRSVASAARDVEQLADALGLERFAVMGASGGGPHALACAALLPDRVSAAVTLAGIAPYPVAPGTPRGFDFFAGMADPSGLRAALRGRDARRAHELTAEFDPDSFIDRDIDALNGPWSSLGADVALATAAGPAGLDGLIDDDVAFTRPWGFELESIVAPVLLVQGSRDRVVPPLHAEWMLARIPSAELWSRPLDGHISVLNACPAALDWMSSHP
ncbi:alpha/beta fold hydrolase [Subtercola sp. YIM 133946]|uniref:alpha/beta fold hydrolase n=1 Tax=Subtercola sp. YIM 133946 TaxID=3118909 RepID=UPI002F9558AA